MADDTRVQFNISADDVTEIIQTCTANYEPWLRSLADLGKKGVVNNIDARALGRAAEAMGIQSAMINGMQARIVELEDGIDKIQETRVAEFGAEMVKAEILLEEVKELLSRPQGYISNINL